MVLFKKKLNDKYNNKQLKEFAEEEDDDATPEL
jgi:hypothetical protein